MKFLYTFFVSILLNTAVAVGQDFLKGQTQGVDTEADIKAAQKELQRNLKDARTSSAISQSPNFAMAREAILEALTSPVFESNRAEVLMEAGNVEYNCYEVERNKPAKGGKIDYAVLYPATVKGFNYLSEAYNIFLEREKLTPGIKAAIQKKAWTLFNVTDGFRAAAANAFESKDWETAHECFDLFVQATESKVINDYAATAGTKIKNQLRQYTADSIIAHAKYFRAISAIYMNNVDLAISDLEEIKYDGFEQNVVLQELCGMYQIKGEESKFIDLLEEGIVLLPNEPWYARNLVNVYLDKKQYKTASDIIDKLIKVDPENPENLALKGQLVEHLGELDTALMYFEKSYAIDPNNREINSHLGRMWYNKANKIEVDLFENRRFDEAETESMPLYIKAAEYYLKAFEFDTDHADLTIARAIRTIHYKRFTKANCPNKNELIEQYNRVSRAYGMSVFPR